LQNRCGLDRRRNRQFLTERNTMKKVSSLPKETFLCGCVWH
jgi:hypothetical protein